MVAFINQLDKKATYNYLNPKNKGVIQIVEVELPEGPIRIKRWNPSKGESAVKEKIEPISIELIWRIANAFSANQPINFDRVLGGSYNTRSVLEALLAHTPQFQFCYPGRIETTGGNPTIKRGHKHLMWTPDEPHKKGVVKETKTEIVISEVPNLEAFYDALVVSSDDKKNEIDINVQRRHAQIQIALYHIGLQLGFRTWIAQNDKGILYQNKKLGEFDGIIVSLKDEKLMSAYDDAIRAALLIDCIWFKNGKLMPAVMEVEHSTGVTSGLSRMKNFKDKFPPFPTRYVIVAPDEDRDKVIKESNKPQFNDLDTRFFPYSAVEELYALCQKRKLRGVTEEFLDCYMEKILN
ncbi:MAG: restriction endonuclease [Bacteroidetes bacterium]|nr:restriction endonuclease [Bacteroidota bacterium]